jgi:hypothetical protein
MVLRKSTIGFACILLSFILTRVAVYLSHPTPGMDPNQIWNGMSAGLKAVVFGCVVLFAYGVLTLIRVLVYRIRKMFS